MVVLKDIFNRAIYVVKRNQQRLMRILHDLPSGSEEKDENEKRLQRRHRERRQRHNNDGKRTNFD